MRTAEYTMLGEIEIEELTSKDKQKTKFLAGTEIKIYIYFTFTQSKKF